MKVVNSSVACYSVAAAQVIAGQTAMVTRVNTGMKWSRLIDDDGNLVLVLERTVFRAIIVSARMLAGHLTYPRPLPSRFIPCGWPSFLRRRCRAIPVHSPLSACSPCASALGINVDVVDSFIRGGDGVVFVERVRDGGFFVTHTGDGHIDRFRLRAAVNAGNGNAAATMAAVVSRVAKGAAANPYVLFNFTHVLKSAAKAIVAKIHACIAAAVEKYKRAYGNVQVRGSRLALRCDVSGLASRRNRLFRSRRSARQRASCETWN